MEYSHYLEDTPTDRNCSVTRGTSSMTKKPFMSKPQNGHPLATFGHLRPRSWGAEPGSDFVGDHPIDHVKMNDKSY